MKKYNKSASLIMVLALVIATMAGCGDDNKPAGSASGGGDNASYTIGICQQLEHPALDEATKGFQAAVEEKLGKDNVKFDLQNAQGEAANCSTIAAGFVASDVDLIMANATGSLQASAAATADIPIVATSVTDYATALDISDWTGSTGKNITGTSDLAPLEQQAAMIKEIVPDAKMVGLLYCSNEPNSIYQINKVKEELAKMSIECKEYSAADSNEIQAVVSNAVKECDVLYIPTDNTMANNTEIVNNIATPAKIPVIAGEEGICKGCGVATLSISYYDIGYRAGEMAAEILKDGKDPKDMPIETAKEFKKLYNPTIAQALSITIPEGYDAIKTDEAE